MGAAARALGDRHEFIHRQPMSKSRKHRKQLEARVPRECLRYKLLAQEAFREKRYVGHSRQISWKRGPLIGPWRLGKVPWAPPPAGALLTSSQGESSVLKLKAKLNQEYKPTSSTEANLWWVMVVAGC